MTASPVCSRFAYIAVIITHVSVATEARLKLADACPVVSLLLPAVGLENYPGLLSGHSFAPGCGIKAKAEPTAEGAQTLLIS